MTSGRRLVSLAFLFLKIFSIPRCWQMVEYWGGHKRLFRWASILVVFPQRKLNGNLRKMLRNTERMTCRPFYCPRWHAFAATNPLFMSASDGNGFKTHFGLTRWNFPFFDEIIDPKQAAVAPGLLLEFYHLVGNIKNFQVFTWTYLHLILHHVFAL